MKKFYYLIVLFIAFFFSACERFDPPEIKLQTVNHGDTLHSFYGAIIDGGGSENFNLKGCVYGLMNEPTLLKEDCKFFEVDGYQKRWFFQWEMRTRDYFSVPDTVYYVRAYVKTNAGIGYSNPVRVETKPRNNF